MTDSLIIVGAIAGAFGVRGEVRLKSFCSDPADIARYAPLSLENGRVFGRVTLSGQTSGALIGRLEGITTPEEANALKGQSLYAGRARLPTLPDDEFYYADLIGLPVFDAGGAVLGTVLAVHNHGAGDLIEVARPAGEPVLIPFTRLFVPTVDLARRRIVADPPDGLF